MTETSDTNGNDAADTRAATADSRESTADSRVATTDSRMATEASRKKGKRSDRSTIALLLSTMALLAAGIVGLYNQHQASQVQDCLRTYVSDAAPLANAADEARQQLWDDFKAFQAVKPTDTATLAKLRTAFFHDLDAERRANDLLKEFRVTHSPAKVCPS